MNVFSRLICSLATMVLLFTGQSIAADKTSNLSGDNKLCAILGCSTPVRGPAGPVGPRGPAGADGRAPQQDVYAGTYRMGKLIDLDASTQCSPNYSYGADQTYDVGLIGLVETSTGYMVYLCIGVKFPPNDVGAGLGGLSFVSLTGTDRARYFKDENCTGATYVVVQSPNDSDAADFSGNDLNFPGRQRGVFGNLMGKPRVSIITAKDLGILADGRRFYTTGPSEFFVARGVIAFEGSTCGRFSSEPAHNQARNYVALKANDPSITGLPNAPETPYLIRDAQ